MTSTEITQCTSATDPAHCLLLNLHRKKCFEKYDVLVMYFRNFLMTGQSWLFPCVFPALIIAITGNFICFKMFVLILLIGSLWAWKGHKVSPETSPSLLSLNMQESNVQLVSKDDCKSVILLHNQDTAWWTLQHRRRTLHAHQDLPLTGEASQNYSLMQHNSLQQIWITEC